MTACSKIFVSRHARERTRERFPSLSRASDVALNRLILGVAFRGQAFGRSVVVGERYVRGWLPPGSHPVVLLLKQDTRCEVVLTVMTEAQALESGAFDREGIE